LLNGKDITGNLGSKTTYGSNSPIIDKGNVTYGSNSPVLENVKDSAVGVGSGNKVENRGHNYTFDISIALTVGAAGCAGYAISQRRKRKAS
jgi:hypothetical protein